jgi:hypothetical protein
LPLSTLPTQSIMPCECRQLFFFVPRLASEPHRQPSKNSLPCLPSSVNICSRFRTIGHRGRLTTTEQRAVYHGSWLDATTIFAPGLEASHPITFSLDTLCRFCYNPSRAFGAGAGFLQSFRALRGFLIYPFAIGNRCQILQILIVESDCGDIRLNLFH